MSVTDKARELLVRKVDQIDVSLINEMRTLILELVSELESAWGCVHDVDAVIKEWRND